MSFKNYLMFNLCGLVRGTVAFVQISRLTIDKSDPMEAEYVAACQCIVLMMVIITNVIYGGVMDNVIRCLMSKLIEVADVTLLSR